jgi:hypothetical protein
MSGFARYARENGIHIHGGRGSFAKKAGEVWKDLKGKPAWSDNLNVILPPYLEGIEGPSGGPLEVNAQERRKQIVATLGANQFEWWNIKALYGLWYESIHVLPIKDRLFVIDSEGYPFEISTDENSFALYRMFKDEVDRGMIDEYSYVSFEDTEINENNGVDLIFTVNETTKYTKKIFEKTTYEWDKKIKDMYALKKEALGPEGAEKLTRTKISVSKEAKKAAQAEGKPKTSAKIKAETRKLEELNKAVDRLEAQFKQGIISKAEYRKHLNRLYKL